MLCHFSRKQQNHYGKKPTAEEVRKSFNSSNNNKAPGEDNINGEQSKYGIPLLDKTIAEIYNNTAFDKHEDLDINGEVQHAIQKLGKKKGPPGNLRQITLLNSLRKALLFVTLNRIRPQVEEYLKNQNRFRPERSTADVIWTHRWLAAKALKIETAIKISGIDLSAAFHTINRSHLLDIV